MPIMPRNIRGNRNIVIIWNYYKKGSSIYTDEDLKWDKHFQCLPF